MVTVPAKFERLDDARLVELVREGDQQAFAELYERYFGSVYDFLARMMRNRTEAEDVAQDAFIRAINSIANLRKGSSFKSWIFTIARNTALNRIEREKRTRPLIFEDSEGDAVELDLIDRDAFNSPDDAARAAATAELVWEAAAGLSVKQYSLLDLHLRQGLESAEIAEVLGVTANNAYVMINRLKSAVEESIGAYVMMKAGRNQCPKLDAELQGGTISGLSPSSRRLVKRHVATCEICQQTQAELVSPAMILGAFVPVAPGPGVREAILSNVLRQWPGSGNAIDGRHNQQTARIQATTPTLVATTGKELLSLAVGLLAIVLGLFLLTGAILNPFGNDSNDSNLTDSSSGAILKFRTEAGDPVAGITLQINYLPVGSDTAVMYELETAGSGTIDLGDNGPGDYTIVVSGLPPEFEAVEATQISEFTVQSGEQLEMQGVFRTVEH